MKILVTGASGFVGSAITRKLAGSGHEVTGLVRAASGAGAVEDAGASVVVGDLMRPGPWAAAIRECELVVNATCPYRPDEKVSLAESRRRSYHHGQALTNLFMAAQDTGVRAVASIYGVLGFGDRAGEWINEKTDLRPVGFERMVTGAFWHADKTSRRTRVPVINLFSGWAYGPGGWFETLVRQVRNGSARLLGEGGNCMSLVHVDDLAAAVAAVADKMPVGERFCVVDGSPVTQAGLVGAVAARMGRRLPRSITPETFSHMYGELAAESWSASQKVSADKMRAKLLPAPRYPDINAGLPPVLDRLGVPPAGVEDGSRHPVYTIGDRPSLWCA